MQITRDFQLIKADGAIHKRGNWPVGSRLIDVFFLKLKHWDKKNISETKKKGSQKSFRSVFLSGIKMFCLILQI